MSTDDQWFNPGEKVIQICDDCPPDVVEVDGSYETQWGVVYCVKECWHDGRRNWVDFVGFPEEFDQADGKRIAWLAAHFRRVDEIKMCVEAAKHIRQREEELV